MTQFNETYPEMVRNLFKPLPTIGEQVHHATTGISGEVAELADAVTRENIIEEIGDLCFYCEALRQQLGDVDPLAEGWKNQVAPLGNLMMTLSIIAGRMLDLTKKVWIYGKPLPVLPLTLELSMFEGLLSQLCELLGTSIVEVQAINQAKLMKRYPSGYTNEAAIARADKV